MDFKYAQNVGVKTQAFLIGLKLKTFSVFFGNAKAYISCLFSHLVQPFLPMCGSFERFLSNL